MLGGALAGTLGLSFIGMVALRYLGPEIGFRRSAVLLAIAIALATAGLGLLLARLLLRPIRALERFASEQEAGGSPEPPRHFGTRELYATARRVIAMAEALRNRETSIRAFTDHVTHELRTPVAAVRAAVELLEDSPALTPEDRALLVQIDSARAQLERQLSALRDAARARETRHLGSSALAEVMPALCADWPGLTLRVGGEVTALPMATEGLRLVLGHLLRNATEHGADTVTMTAVANGSGCSILVQDNGRGISVGNAQRVFDPFFTTRREEGGTGMALTVVWNILAAHHAGIALADSTTGAPFRLTFASRET